MHIQQEIRLVAESMGVGETIRQVCPSCYGGSKKERSLTITVFPSLQVRYNCFRESCDIHGAFFLHNAEPIRTSSLEDTPIIRDFKPVQPKRKLFNGHTYPLTEFEVDWIYKAWGITCPPFWYHTPQYGGRIAMSIRGPSYTHRGWVLRDIEGYSANKALTYVDEKETPLSWYRNRELKGTIIVEDIPSAVRASKYINSVALLGVGAGLDRAMEIDENAPRPIYIALDQDAIREAFAMADRWGLLWGQVTVLPLKQDIKNLLEPDLEALLKRAMM
jgi:hypothetical protein